MGVRRPERDARRGFGSIGPHPRSPGHADSAPSSTICRATASRATPIVSASISRPSMTSDAPGASENPPHGLLCDVRIEVQGLGDRASRVAVVRTAWELRYEGDAPQLVTAYIRA